MMTLPFDTILVEVDGSRQVLSTDEFMSLNLATRIRYIMTKGLEFRHGNQLVERSRALAALQRMGSPKR